MLAVIGGSGLYDIEELEDTQRRQVDTPFGSPSDEIVVGRIGNVEVAFLPRHGRGHHISPSELNFRANIYALKKLGADTVLSISAVGSLREEIVPGQIVIPDQFIDRTRGRVSTFFSDGIVAHIGFADPFCAPLSRTLEQSAKAAGAVVHQGGTYVCMEGPAFSTRAESNMYRAWGADIIGMTNLQEAKLAREAELCFITLALATDYDCWRDDGDAVGVGDVLAVLRANVELARRTVVEFAERFEGDERSCACRRALDGAVLSDVDSIGSDTMERLDLILSRSFAEKGNG